MKPINSVPEKEEKMSLRDAIEYIRNDEAYVAAQLEADRYDALRKAAEAALPLLDLYRGMIQPSSWAKSASTAEVIAQLRKALGKE